MIAGAAFSFGSLNVSAASGGNASTFNFTIDYLRETVFVAGAVFDTTSSLEDAKCLMYALKVDSSDARAVGRAKWFPTYSGEIDVSKYIPNKGNKSYFIAFKSSDDDRNEKVESVELKARQTIGRADVTYDTDKQQITAVGGGFEVKLNDDVYDDGGNWGLDLSDEKSILIPKELLPTGGTALARKKAITEGDNKAFASATIRIKLPAPPKPVNTSRITLLPEGDRKNKDAYFKGVTDKMEVLADDGTWKRLGKNMKAADFDKLNPKKTETKDGDVVFEVRVAARGKSSASLPSYLDIKKADYEKATAEQNPNQAQ